jgi:lipopolysaccharide export system permease protein
MAPLYPIAIAVLTFAYLGAPRTTRQGRTLSMLGAIGMVSVLRGAGFVGTIAGPHLPAALFIPYATFLLALGLGAWAISRGVIIEPPALITDTVAAVTAYFTDRSARLLGQTP